MSGKVKLGKLKRVKRGVDLDDLSVIVLNLLSLQVILVLSLFNRELSSLEYTC